ncbi:MAG: transposase [Bifidobacteriaceae bacterium]|nr:transposase [Bifidobacteriaceae bacterium]
MKIHFKGKLFSEEKPPTPTACLISNGKTEGISRKIKTLRRHAYGYPDNEYFFLNRSTLDFNIDFRY